MTNEALALLDQLSRALDPVAAKERSIQREFGRSPLINFTATIFIDPEQPTIQVTQGKVGGNQWDETHLAVQLKDVEVTKHGDYGWFEDTDYQITMRVADEGFENREDDEAVLWFGGIQQLIPGVTLANINGKRITFEEQHKQYTYKRKKNNYIPEEGTRWWYQAVKLVGQTKPSSATPSEEAVEKAISLLVGDGMTIVEFARACSKEPVINKDKALISLLSSKMDSFIADQVGKGRILRDRENVVAI